MAILKHSISSGIEPWQAQDLKNLFYERIYPTTRYEDYSQSDANLATDEVIQIESILSDDLYMVQPTFDRNCFPISAKACLPASICSSSGVSALILIEAMFAMCQYTASLMEPPELSYQSPRISTGDDYS